MPDIVLEQGRVYLATARVVHEGRDGLALDVDVLRSTFERALRAASSDGYQIAGWRTEQPIQFAGDPVDLAPGFFSSIFGASTEWHAGTIFSTVVQVQVVPRRNGTSSQVNRALAEALAAALGSDADLRSAFPAQVLLVGLEANTIPFNAAGQPVTPVPAPAPSGHLRLATSSYQDIGQASAQWVQQGGVAPPGQQAVPLLAMPASNATTGPGQAPQTAGTAGGGSKALTSTTGQTFGADAPAAPPQPPVPVPPPATGTSTTTWLLVGVAGVAVLGLGAAVYVSLPRATLPVYPGGYLPPPGMPSAFSPRYNPRQRRPGTRRTRSPR